jgi:predicted RNase H-like HicB family nuclease
VNQEKETITMASCNEYEGVINKYQESRNEMVPDSPTLQWTGFPERSLVLRVFLCPEQEGGFSVIAPDLPGVVSQGETEEEAKANIVEAFLGALEVYASDSEAIPWNSERSDMPSGAIECRIVVNV